MNRSIFALLAGVVFVIGVTLGHGGSMAASPVEGIAAAPVSAHFAAPTPVELGSPRCYQCSDSSTGACKRNSNSLARCWGTKKECRKKGCRGMSGSSSSCSGFGANVPRC